MIALRSVPGVYGPAQAMECRRRLFSVEHVSVECKVYPGRECHPTTLDLPQCISLYFKEVSCVRHRTFAYKLRPPVASHRRGSVRDKRDGVFA